MQPCRGLLLAESDLLLPIQTRSLIPRHEWQLWHIYFLQPVSSNLWCLLKRILCFTAKIHFCDLCWMKTPLLLSSQVIQVVCFTACDVPATQVEHCGGPGLAATWEQGNVMLVLTKKQQDSCLNLRNFKSSEKFKSDGRRSVYALKKNTICKIKISAVNFIQVKTIIIFWHYWDEFLDFVFCCHLIIHYFKICVLFYRFKTNWMCLNLRLHSAGLFSALDLMHFRHHTQYFSFFP